MTLSYAAANRMVASMLGPYAVAHEGPPVGFAVPRVGGMDYFAADERDEAIDACLRWQSAGFFVDLYDGGWGAYHHPIRDSLEQEEAA